MDCGIGWVLPIVNRVVRAWEEVRLVLPQKSMSIGCLPFLS